MARDSQRSRCYAWEKKHPALKPLWSAKSMTKDEVIALVHRVCDELGRHRPRILFTKRRGGACASRWEMNFTPTRMPPILVIHELAHVLTYPYECKEGHGAVYMGCYIALLEAYFGFDGEALYVDAIAGAKYQDIRRVVVDYKEATVVQYTYTPGGGVSTRHVKAMQPIYETKEVETRTKTLRVCRVTQGLYRDKLWAGLS